MANWFASRGEGGLITGLYARKQPGYAEEIVADTSPEAVTFLNQDPTPELRNAALAFIINTGPVSKAVRAVLLVLLDEINTLRVAAGLPARTVAQAKAAFTAKINSGAADV